MNSRMGRIISVLIASCAVSFAADVFVAAGSSIENAIQKAGPRGRVFLKGGQHAIARPIQIRFPITITADPVEQAGSVQIRAGGPNFPVFISAGVSGVSITNLNFVPASGLAGADRRGQGGTVWQALNCSNVTFTGNRVYNFQEALHAVNCSGVVNAKNVVR